MFMAVNDSRNSDTKIASDISDGNKARVLLLKQINNGTLMFSIVNDTVKDLMMC